MLGLRNEFIMAPVKLGYSDGTGIVTQRHLDFYNERSKHIGAVALEPLYMDPGLRELPTQLGIDNDEKITELTKITELLHQNGAKAIAHLNHPGRMANPKIPGNFHWSSTDKSCESGGATPVKMDREMMDKVITMHVEASKRAVKAGFDIVELQFGHGYLMAQFLSPAVNDRNDEYGGSLENRVRFPMEVFKAVRAAVDVPLIVRVSGDEMTPNGFHVDEMEKFTAMLEQAGASAIHVVAGTACSNPPWFFQHMFIPKGKTWELAGKLKQKLNIPVVFVGRINSFKDVELIKEKYNGDIIALGRAMVADPDFVGKYLKQVDGLLRPCLACAEGCLGGVKSGKGLGCVVNPLVNTGLKKPEKVTEPKKFAVVGGGLAGMEAAVTLAKRGHKVDLYEKDEPGGQFNLAWLPPKKESLKEIVDYYIGEVNNSEVKVIHKEACSADISEGGYDGVVMATGAVPAVPPIKGLKKFYWTEFLHDDQLPHGKKVVVIGGGLIGLEVASKLIDNDNEVIVVEMLGEMARGMEMIEKAMTMKKMKEKGAVMLVNHKVTEVEDDKVIVEGPEGQKVFDKVDHVVVATGMKSYVPFDLEGDIPVYTVGDAKKVGKAQEAIREAYELVVDL
jgi:2,4-dienoyl-CoA reductase-like NADH-dependent reductase (Old Yellow Enzyme family)/thioredoxin reductase